MRDRVGLSPNRIMTDFEAGSIKAMQEVKIKSLKRKKEILNRYSRKRIFRDASSILVRQILDDFRYTIRFGVGNDTVLSIQRLPNLLEAFNNDEHVRMRLKSLQSLAFVPTNLVYSYFAMLMSTFEPTNEIQGL